MERVETLKASEIINNLINLFHNSKLGDLIFPGICKNSERTVSMTTLFDILEKVFLEIKPKLTTSANNFLRANVLNIAVCMVGQSDRQKVEEYFQLNYLALLKNK
jgi:hypothetical protein